MIDIIIPTYKPEDYLFECLSSIDQQDCSFEDFVVTIVLNGPKDDYFDLIEKWLSTFNFKSNLLYSAVAGVSSARNIGLDNTNSAQILFIDDDDMISSNLINSVKHLTSESGVVVVNTYNFIDDINVNIKDYLTFESSFETNNLLKYRKYLSNSCCKIIPRKLIGDNRFIKKLKLSEDAVFMFQISKSIEYFVFTDPSAIYFRRIRLNSASRKKQSIFIYLVNIFKVLVAFTFVYLSHPREYSFLLFITRILATFKRFFSSLRNTFRLFK